MKQISQLQQITLVKVRKINVVNVYYDPRTQAGNGFQIQVNDLAARFNDMRCINKEQVPCLELLKQIWIYSLYWLFDKFDGFLAPHTTQKLAGVWLNACQLSSVSFAFVARKCPQRAVGRYSGTHLADLPRLERAEHTVQTLGLNIAKSRPEAPGRPFIVSGIAAVFRFVWLYHLKQLAGLFGDIHVHPNHCRTVRPNSPLPAQFMDVGDRGIIVVRQHYHAGVKRRTVNYCYGVFCQSFESHSH